MSSIRLLMYQVVVIFLAHSIGMISSFHWNALMQSRGVRRPSVCLSVNFAQIASSTTNMTRSPPNLHTMVPRWACIQGVLKVKVKVIGHVIRTLFCVHENRFFYHKHDSIATKLEHDGPQMGLHPGCAQGQGQRSRDTDTFCVHENRFFYHKHDSIATKLAHDDPQMGLHSGCAQGQGQHQRSRDTDSCNFTKIASSFREIAGSRPNLHTMVCRRAHIHDVLKVKVKVKGHVIRALL